jgi:signal transduction histidine kinase
VAAVVLLGCGAIAFSAADLPQAPLNAYALLLAGLVIGAGRWPLKVPGFPATVSVSEVFVFAFVLLFGPVPAMFVVAFDGLIVSLTHRHRRADRLLFNVFEPAISVWASGSVFFLISGVEPLAGSPIPTNELFVPTAAMASVYFLLNSALTAIAISLETGASARQVWRRHALFLALNYYAGASLAALAVHNTIGVNLQVIGLVAPLLVVSYMAYNAASHRLNDAERHVEELRRRDEELSEARARLEVRVAERTRTLEFEIVKHRRTENQLILAKAAAEEANTAKSAFLANMSHELRTPLNAILGYSEMMKEEAEDRGTAEGCEDLDKIISASHHLLALITDVLDLSKIEAGQMELHIEAIDADALVSSVVSTSELLAQARGNQIIASGLQQLGTLRSDRTKLQQVLLNLVGNACKFTSRGEVHIDCRREPGEGSDWLVVDVSDTGVGISPEQLGRLFRDFTQADPSTTRRFGGTGLGLAISQRLCRLMGGTITVRSEVGRGSTFTVRVPAELQVPPLRLMAAKTTAPAVLVSDPAMTA